MKSQELSDRSDAITKKYFNESTLSQDQWRKETEALAREVFSHIISNPLEVEVMRAVARSIVFWTKEEKLQAIKLLWDYSVASKSISDQGQACSIIYAIEPGLSAEIKNLLVIKKSDFKDRYHYDFLYILQKYGS